MNPRSCLSIRLARFVAPALMGLVPLVLLLGCGGAAEEVATDEAAVEMKPVEIDLGSYRFRAFDPTANTETKFDFQIAGKIEGPSQEVVEQEVANKQNRIRDRVLVVSRESTARELEDPELEMFRRRLIKELNRILEQGQIQDVYLSHYRVKTR
ncbi:MAG: flagellar basal body-associated FliL family protein [Pirellulaceae bacterium]